MENEDGQKITSGVEFTTPPPPPNDDERTKDWFRSDPPPFGRVIALVKKMIKKVASSCRNGTSGRLSVPPRGAGATTYSAL